MSVGGERSPVTGKQAKDHLIDPLECAFDSNQQSETIVVDLRMETQQPDPPLAGWLDVELARLAQLAGLKRGLICVTIVDDAQMARLHQQYRQVPDTTDVLTFNLSEGSQACLEGDVVVCLDEAVRQASARDHPLRHEILLYALHGLLHLLGYDDRDPKDAMRMHKREDELLVAAGFGPIYGAAEMG